MAGGSIGYVNEPPFADFNPVTTVLADDARVVAVGAVIFGVNRPMEDRPDEFTVAPIDRGRSWGVADLKRERLFEFKPTR